MRVVLPPGQRLPHVSATVSITRAEATELRDALNLVLDAGRSQWAVYASYAEIEAEVNVTLQMDSHPTVLNSA